MVHIVTYDLRDPGADYAEIKEAISKFRRCKRIQKSVWLVVTDKTVEEVRSFLRRSIDDNDRLFVGRLYCDLAWYKLLTDAEEWIIDELPSSEF